MRLNSAELNKPKTIEWKIILPIILWAGLNLADTICTYNIIRLGGQETWFIYQWTNSMVVTSLIKWLAVILIPLILWKYHKIKWLWLFNIETMIIAGWNVCQLVIH